MRTPLVIIAVTAAALLGLDALLAGGHGAPAGKAERTAPVATVAHRVEALRGLRFDAVPRARSVTPAQASREGLADFDASYPRRRRLADEEVLTLLGLAPAGFSLRAMSASLFAEGVGGYYDPRTKRLRTVSGSATGTRLTAETVLAHELTHALEDQRYGLLDVAEGAHKGDDDAALAELALTEGTATEVMDRYLTRYFSASEILGGSLGAAFAGTGTGDMPPFLQAQLVFPYIGGERLVADLLRRAGDRWDLVDTAERLRPPVSTEQVMHPERYMRADVPRPVRLGVRAALGARWTRAATGTWGELQTRELLAVSGGGGHAAAAAGWGGDRWELWRARPLGECGSPCRDADVLVMRWRWDTPRDEQEFADRLRRWVLDARGGSAAAGPGAWTLEGGRAAAIARRGGAVTLALAPAAGLARRAAAAPGA
jgi:hypothetical protein